MASLFPQHARDCEGCWTLCSCWPREQGAVNYVIELLGDEECADLLPDLCTSLTGLGRLRSNRRKAKYAMILSCANCKDFVMRTKHL